MENEVTELGVRTRELFTRPQIIGAMKNLRIRWLGYVERRDERTLLGIMYKGNPGGISPRRAWLRGVIEDLKEMGIRT